MRTNKGAEVALNAVFAVPFGNVNCNTSLFKSGGAEREGAVLAADKGRNGELVSALGVDGLKDLLGVLFEFLAALEGLGCLGGVLGLGPIGRNVDLFKAVYTALDSGVVHGNDLFALLAVRLGCGSLHEINGLRGRNDLRKSKECGLQNGVGTSAETELLGNVGSVDGIEIDLVLGDVALHSGRKSLGELLDIP